VRTSPNSPRAAAHAARCRPCPRLPLARCWRRPPASRRAAGARLQRTLAVAGALLSVISLAGAATGRPADAVEQQAPVLWEVSRSWPGGDQYDQRLDRTVKLWATGAPVANVLASLTEQTGVRLASFPWGDNARVCLNVYLNPNAGPTLRDVLVQISWVMECAWALEGKADERRYVLLSTSVGGGVPNRLREAGASAAGARAQDSEAAEREGEEVALDKLQEIGDSLGLSRDEVIRRYKGKDDLMLLALLDPAKRAMARFCLTLDPEQLRLDHGASLKWQDLSPDQKSLLQKALEPALEQTAQALREGWLSADPARVNGWSASDRWDDWDWVQRQVLGDLDLSLSYGFVLNSRRGPGSFEPVPGVPGALRPGVPDRPQLPATWLLLYRDPRDPVTMQQDVGEDLRRLLGEKVPGEPSPEFEGELPAAREYREKQQRALIERQLAELVHLTPAAAKRLSSLHLPATSDKPYALWQLQEAVAALSGMHIISDNFWQPARSAKQILGLLRQDLPSEPDALLLLQMATVATEGRDRLLYGPVDPTAQMTRWEWGDAGEFLHFRSADRDVWRAAFLPADVVETLDDWLAPHLPENLAQASHAAVPLDVRQCGALLKQLSFLQQRWGGALSYGSASDEKEWWREAFRSQCLAAIRESDHFYIWLSGLSNGQWELVQGDGLRVGVDVGPQPETGDQSRREPAVLPGSILRVRSATSNEGETTRALPPGRKWCYVEFVVDDGRGGQLTRRPLVTEMAIRPLRLRHLVGQPR